MTDLELDNLIKRLRECGKSSYYISKHTGLSNSTLANWLAGKTKPTPANISILEHFLSGIESENNAAGIVIQGSNRMRNSSIVNHGAAYPDMPEAFRRALFERDSVISVLEEQVREKDAQINKLLEILRTK